MPDWPATLPPVSLAGYQSTSQDSVLRSEMDAGPGKARRRFTAVSEYIACQIKLKNSTQRTALDSFYTTTLLHGSLTFTWTHPVTGASVTARFRKPPVKTPTPGKVVWIYGLDIEVLP